MTNRINPRPPASPAPLLREKSSPMVAFLRKVVTSKPFREIVRLLAAALVAHFSTGCGVFQEPKSPVFAAFECRAELLAPYVGDAAPVIAAQIAAGQVSAIELLLSLGLTPDEILALAKKYRACDPAPSPAATPVDLPPPAGPDYSRS